MLTLLSIIPSTAYSDTAGDFIKSLAGKYSGKGTAEVIPGKRDRVSCKITNSFSSETTQLAMDGLCASVRGKGNVSGSIEIINGEIKGSFINGNSDIVVTQSSGQMSGAKLVLSSSLMDQKVGKLSRMRQIISKTDTGFVTDFYVFDNKSGKYEPSGSLTLKQL